MLWSLAYFTNQLVKKAEQQNCGAQQDGIQIFRRAANAGWFRFALAQTSRSVPIVLRRPLWFALVALSRLPGRNAQGIDFVIIVELRPPN
jgi:hypothetical protein